MIKYTFEVFRNQYPAVVSFVQHLAYHRGLQAAGDSPMDCKTFWTATSDSHLKIATIAWCNVFGSHKEDMHWAKTPTGDIVHQAQKDFRHMVLSKTGFTQEQWESYRKKMLGFRDKYVAHFDIGKPFDGPVPLFDPALQVVYAYQEWVRELMRPILLNQSTLISLYEQCKSEAFNCRYKHN